MGFTKLDEGILQSSIMAESPPTFKVWIAILAACDYDGIARVSSVFLSSVCHLSLDLTDKAIAHLEAADKRSRSLEEEGRRIRRVDGGFFVINYQRYRAFTVSDAPEAIRQRKKRERDRALHVTKSRDISASASASSSVSFISQGRVWEGITAADMESWAAAYPACDINVELRKAGEWIIANPAKGKKSNYRRFIVNWLSRQQDRGGSGGEVKSYAPYTKPEYKASQVGTVGDDMAAQIKRAHDRNLKEHPELKDEE